MINKDQNQRPATAERGNNTLGLKRGNLSRPRTEQGKSEIVKAEIMKTWNRLSDEDVRLYDRQQKLFFDRIKEKHGVGHEEAQKRLSEILESSATEAAA